MRKHVTHLLGAYTNGQLRPADRQRVAVHVRVCPECRAALADHQQLARNLGRFVPQIGQPQRGQLARLWPAIWREFRTPPGRLIRWLPSYGLVLALMMLFAFAFSALFTGPSHAIAAPVQVQQAVPAEVRATMTPVRTDEPLAVDTLRPSETASALIQPLASPAPHAGPTHSLISDESSRTNR